MAQETRKSAGWPLLVLPFTLLLAAPALAPPAAAQEGEIANAPDFSDVTSKAKAQRLVRSGELVEILFFPAEFGGPDEPQNIGYITPEAADIRDMIIGTFTRFAEDGLIDQLKVVPDYKGDSLVPSSITMTGTGGEDDDGAISLTIAVW
jgi:hypothetical protein